MALNMMTSEWANHKLNCSNSIKHLLKIKKTHRCTECIKEYLENKEGLFQKKSGTRSNH